MLTSRALVVYARPPVAGKVKTRLVPTYTEQEAASLYEAMLADTVERAVEADHDTTVFVAFSGEVTPAGDLADVLKRARVEYQVGDELGERMAGTLQDKLRAGFRQAVIIGSDSPNLPIDYLDQAFEALMAVDVVMGPTADGGYYLIGGRRLHPRLFQRMPWGTDQVLTITRQRIKDGRVTHHELPAWYDVDTPADVARLWKDLQHMKAKGAEDLPRRTFRALAAMPGRR